MVPIKIEMQNVLDIAAINVCSISAFTTTEGKVYFWGFAYGLLIPDPVTTKFNSMTELFASLDTPMMLEPVECDRDEPRLEKLRESFDDQVKYCRHVDSYLLIYLQIVISYLFKNCRKQQI